MMDVVKTSYVQAGDLDEYIHVAVCLSLRKLSYDNKIHTRYILKFLNQAMEDILMN